MRGAIREDLGVTGAIVADVSTTDTSGTLRSTRQLIYVSDKIEKASCDPGGPPSQLSASTCTTAARLC